MHGAHLTEKNGAHIATKQGKAWWVILECSTG